MMDSSNHTLVEVDNGNVVTLQDNCTTVTTPSTPPTTTIDNSEATVPSVSDDSEQEDKQEKDDKAAFRSPYASRQTVAELEAKAHADQGNSDEKKKSLSRAFSSQSSGGATEPGAVAMYRSDSNSTSCSAAAAMDTTDEVPIIHAQLAEDATASSRPIVIEAHLADDPQVAIPQAEPVVPPPVALHVQFDEEAPPTQPPTTTQGVLPSYTTGGMEPPTKIKKLWAQHGKPSMRFLMLLLVAGLIAGIVIPKIHHQKETEELNDQLEWLEGFLGEDLQIALTAPTPAPSRQTVFDCFESTLAIAQAQAQDPLKQMFSICPNTLIQLGNLTDHHEIEGGDYPLTALGDKVEIRCGLHGRRDEQCVLEGGFLQVILQPSLPDDLSGETVNRTDHVVFRGITFTGNLVDSNGLIGGMSILANNPGQDITFIDCAWENITAPRGLVQIGDSRGDQVSFAPTTYVTFEDCTFSNIVYDGPLIGVYGQGVSIKQSRFEDLTLPSTIEPCPVHDSLDWCHGLLYCFDESVCILEDIYVEGLEYAGPAAVVTASHETNLTVDGMGQSYGLNLHPSVVSTISDTTCSTGMAQFADPAYLSPECLEESGNWTM